MFVEEKVNLIFSLSIVQITDLETECTSLKGKVSSLESSKSVEAAAPPAAAAAAEPAPAAAEEKPVSETMEAAAAGGEPAKPVEDKPGLLESIKMPPDIHGPLRFIIKVELDIVCPMSLYCLWRHRVKRKE